MSPEWLRPEGSRPGPQKEQRKCVPPSTKSQSISTAPDTALGAAFARALALPHTKFDPERAPARSQSGFCLSSGGKQANMKEPKK
jgi:hypothetical protein